jgi:hypothetical protein
MADTAAALDPTVTSVDDLSLCHGLTGLAETLRRRTRLLHDEALATSATAGIAAFANAWQTGPDALDAAQLPVPSDLGQPNDGGSEDAGGSISSGREASRMQYGGLGGPSDDDHGRGLVSLDQVDRDRVDCGDLA